MSPAGPIKGNPSVLPDRSPFVPFPANLQPVRLVRRRNRFVMEVVPYTSAEPSSTQLNSAAGPLLLHMPNTGRMAELLTPGTLGLAVLDGGGERKTAGTLLLVRHEGRWVSVDARMPNRLFEQAFVDGFLSPFLTCAQWRAEVPWGRGRIDFLLWSDPKAPAMAAHGPDTPSSTRLGRSRARSTAWPEGNVPRVLVETKSCNLVEEGTALFPDAPTERGARHLAELAAAVNEGHRAAVVWFVQRDDAHALAPHRSADPVFGEAFDRAVAAGVEMYAYRCHVTPDGIQVLENIPVVTNRLQNK